MLKIWISLVALSGLLIFVHIQELTKSSVNPSVEILMSSPNIEQQASLNNHPESTNDCQFQRVCRVLKRAGSDELQQQKMQGGELNDFQELVSYEIKKRKRRP